jgi:hypothetical protein
MNFILSYDVLGGVPKSTGNNIIMKEAFSHAVIKVREQRHILQQ